MDCASGTATNPATQSHTYQLIVYFTDDPCHAIGLLKTSVCGGRQGGGYVERQRGSLLPSGGQARVGGGRVGTVINVARGHSNGQRGRWGLFLRWPTSLRFTELRTLS